MSIAGLSCLWSFSDGPLECALHRKLKTQAGKSPALLSAINVQICHDRRDSWDASLRKKDDKHVAIFWRQTRTGTSLLPLCVWDIGWMGIGQAHFLLPDADGSLLAPYGWQAAGTSTEVISINDFLQTLSSKRQNDCRFCLGWALCRAIKRNYIYCILETLTQRERWDDGPREWWSSWLFRQNCSFVGNVCQWAPGIISKSFQEDNHFQIGNDRLVIWYF